MMDAERHRAAPRWPSPRCIAAYSEMTVPAGPGWVEEHIRRLQRQRHPERTSSSTNIKQLETVERHDAARRLQGAADHDLGRHRRRLRRPEHLQSHEFRPRARRTAHADAGASMRNVLPINMMAIAMGLHVALRHRGQPLDPGPQAQDELGPADRAARAHRARIRPRGRRPARRPAHLSRSASSTRAPTRRWRATASRPTASAASRASCGTPERKQDGGAQGHDARPFRARPARSRADHWQTLLAAEIVGSAPCRRWTDNLTARRGSRRSTGRSASSTAPSFWWPIAPACDGGPLGAAPSADQSGAAGGAG